MTFYIHSKHIAPRVLYSFELVLGRLLGLELHWEPDLVAFLGYAGPKICYGDGPLGAAFYVNAEGLLFEKGLRPNRPGVSEIGGLPAFFEAADPRCHFPVDVFSMAFWLVARMEEYPSADAASPPYDQHGRFPAKESLAFQNKFLDQPLVNLWARRLGDKLKEKYPDIQIIEPSFQHLPTYDIDYAWSYLHKGLYRTAGAYLRDLTKGDFAQIGRRTKVLFGKEKDPFDTFDQLDAFHAEQGLAPQYFFLLADHGPFDKNISHQHPAMRALVRRIAQRYGGAGIHPSYRAHDEPWRVAMEKKRLEDIIEAPVTKSRQHFLRLRFPQSYRTLIEAGIKEDYTMGYAEMPGFRASISIPFLWYDVLNEQITDLLLHPFQVMDTTAGTYLKMGPEEEMRTFEFYRECVKDVGGEFVNIRHNNLINKVIRHF